jgi:formamidopyrimidine-DNA glycosylase
MPELPEVETTARLLRGPLVGRSFRGLEVQWPRSLGGQEEAWVREQITGARITGVTRRAKLVIIEMARRGRPVGVLAVHLRMTGRLVVLDTGADPGRYARVSLPLDRGVLHFLDVRKFGRMTWHSDSIELFARYGPEPLSDEFSVAWLRRALGGRRRALKPLLLDQSFLAGLGNIYVDEVLFGAGLHPLRRSDRIPAHKVARLHGMIQTVLREAIEREGSSFDSFYRTPEGRPGAYQDQFQVYGRTGKPCRACGRTIRRLVVGQRGTHICTRCQPAPRPLSSSRS